MKKQWIIGLGLLAATPALAGNCNARPNLASPFYMPQQISGPFKPKLPAHVVKSDHGNCGMSLPMQPLAMVSRMKQKCSCPVVIPGKIGRATASATTTDQTNVGASVANTTCLPNPSPSWPQLNIYRKEVIVWTKTLVPVEAAMVNTRLSNSM